LQRLAERSSKAKDLGLLESKLVQKAAKSNYKPLAFLLGFSSFATLITLDFGKPLEKTKKEKEAFASR
jgi:hypothetical protein